MQAAQQAVPDVGPALSQAVTLAENLGGLPILGGNTVELPVDYDDTIARRRYTCAMHSNVLPIPP